MAQLQTQHRSLNNFQAPRALAKTGFPQLGRLPQEIQNAIWKEALQTEAQKIVLFDYETGGIYLSQDLVSSISEVNSAARTVAIEFYNVTLDVFACDLEYFTLSRPRRHQRGVVRLHLDYATFLVGFDTSDLLHEDDWWNIGLPEDSEALQNKLYNASAMTEAETYEIFKEHYHIFANMGRPCQEDVPGYVTAVHVTGGLTESQRAQVRRTVQAIQVFTEDLPQATLGQPTCCWNCESSQREPNKDHKCYGDFPNAGFCRILVVTTWENAVRGAYTLDQLFNDCANLTTAQWWDSIKSRLKFCGKHEHLSDENDGEENNDDDSIDNADEDAAGEFGVVDQHATDEYDAGKREDKEYKKFASVCARKEKSFFF
ncbi:hypothetical protein KJ359_004485 [Pestalotiopsis sp. 9143b]|nr:hypothetical protein KJ359_004485 [Pestalotiopsis sp. 9143b]